MKHCIHLKIFSNLLFCLVRCLCKYLWVCPLKPNKEELLKFKAKHNKRNKLGKYFFFLAKGFFVNFWLRVLLKIATYYSVGAWLPSSFLQCTPGCWFWSLWLFVCNDDRMPLCWSTKKSKQQQSKTVPTQAVAVLGTVHFQGCKSNWLVWYYIQSSHSFTLSDFHYSWQYWLLTCYKKW